MAQQMCLFKDANHVCGEPSVGTIAVGPNAGHTIDVPACQRHAGLMQSSAEAAHLMAETEAQAAPPPSAEGAQTPTQDKPAAA